MRRRSALRYFRDARARRRAGRAGRRALTKRISSATVSFDRSYRAAAASATCHRRRRAAAAERRLKMRHFRGVADFVI